MEEQKEKQNVTLRVLRVDSRLSEDDWIEGVGGEGRGVVEGCKGGRKGVEIIKLIMRYLLKYLEEEFEGKVILKCILIFKDLKYSKRNIV